MFKEELSLVPHLPGCYLMKNKDNIVIYVGKSKNLKNRLSSYFNREHTGKTMMLVREIDHFEYIVTNTEMESLLLEINLIKKYTPKYNILYRDDKSYPYIELTDEKVPRLRIIRRINVKKIKNNLFGPYPNVGAARRVVEILNRVYPLRKCNTYEKRECLYYHIGECLGYCTKNIDEEIIKEMKTEIISFLNGNTKVLTNKLKEKMNKYSNNMEYEKALEYKELLNKRLEYKAKEDKKIVSGQLDMYNYKLADIAHELDKINRESLPSGVVNRFITKRQKLLYLNFERLRRTHEILTLYTPWGEIQKVIIEEIRFNQDKYWSMSGATITVKQLNFTDAVEEKGSNNPFDPETQRKDKVENGNVKTKPVDDFEAMKDKDGFYYINGNGERIDIK